MASTADPSPARQEQGDDAESQDATTDASLFGEESIGWTPEQDIDTDHQLDYGTPEWAVHVDKIIVWLDVSSAPTPET